MLWGGWGFLSNGTGHLPILPTWPFSKERRDWESTNQLVSNDHNNFAKDINVILFYFYKIFTSFSFSYSVHSLFLDGQHQHRHNFVYSLKLRFSDLSIWFFNSFWVVHDKQCPSKNLHTTMAAFKSVQHRSHTSFIFGEHIFFVLLLCKHKM